MRVLPVTFTLSVLINAAALFSVEQIVTLEKVRTQNLTEAARKQKQGDIQFEFVETPLGVKAEKPENSKKISNLNSANQDATLEKEKAEGNPKTASIGPADQLKQQKGEKVAPRSAALGSSASQEKHAQVFPENRSESQGVEDRTSIPAPQRPSPASPAVNASGGEPVQAPQDKITTQEMSKTPSSGARLYGVTSFEATGSGMGEYMKKMKEKIWLAWFPYISFKYPQDYKGASALISFTVGKDGETRLIRIISSQGTPLFATFCMEAIQRAGNFGKLPEEILTLIGKDELEIRFGFHYR